MEVSKEDLLCVRNAAVLCTLYVKIRESILVKTGYSQERLSSYFGFFDRQVACL